jgi:hypothetical protein
LAAVNNLSFGGRAVANEHEGTSESFACFIGSFDANGTMDLSIPIFSGRAETELRLNIQHSNNTWTGIFRSGTAFAEWLTKIFAPSAQIPGMLLAAQRANPPPFPPTWVPQHLHCRSLAQCTHKTAG